MYSRAAIYCLLLCAVAERAFSEEGDYISIFTTRRWAASEDVSIILANMDTVPSTFEIENIGREEGDVIVSTTINPRHTQLYVIPSAWSNTAGDEEALQLDIITSSGMDEEARLTGQIQLAQQPKVLIQLSDVLHTPGDFLNYRIFLANELNQALPRTERPLNVTIALEHEWQHTVESREVVLFPGEVYSGEHLFVDDRDLGDWNLTVTVGEQTTSKQFKVILYSAPIYDIKIGTDEIVTLQYPEMNFHVEARYTFGKPIRGTLYVVVSSDDKRVVERTYPFEGFKMISIPMGLLLDTSNDTETRSVHINATVTTSNGLTKRTYHHNRSIPVYTSPYRLTVYRTVDFAPGQNVTLFAKITKANGMPLQDLHKLPKNTLSVNVKFDDDTKTMKTFEVPVNEDREAVLSFPTDESAELVTVQVLYQGLVRSVTLEPTYSPQLYVRIVPSKRWVRHRRVEDGGFQLALVSSHALEGVLAVIRKHSGENVPLYINCNMQNYYAHPVAGVQLPDVKRVYVFGRYQNTLVQASTARREPAPSEKVRLTVDDKGINVSAKEDGSLVGVAAYEGSLIGAQKQSIYIRAMFNGTVHPEIEDVFPLSINDLMVTPSSEQMETDNLQDLKFDSAVTRINQLLLWEKATIKNRKATFQYNPPPHINQMIVTAFVCSPTRGLGIAEPVQWQRQQDIEIYLHIPYSAKKLEPVTVDVYITNNREEVKYVVVDLLNNANEFSFLENGGRTDATKKSVLGRLQPNEVQRAEFLIRPKKLGSITLKANAYTEGNEVARAETILRTVPESVQRTGSIVRLFNVDNSKEQYTDVKIPIPRTIDTGSEKISFALHREQVQIASLSASMLLDKLVQSDPFTMAMRASLTLEVLALGRLEWKERRALAERMMNESVTKIVSYANADGSFTIPEQHTPSSACWDTVIALQALTFTNEHLESGELEELILKALEWMRTRQAPQGFFCTDDGGPQNDLQQIEKTAHVLSLFLHMKSHIWRYVSVINDARIYLLQSTPKLRDPYHLALVGHVFQLSLQRPTGKKDHSLINEKVTHILAELLDRKQQSPSGLKLWWNTGSTPDLDATGYALMVMTSKKYLFNAAPIVNWIKGQPYRRVMNVSITHNSHIALRALIDYSKHTTFLEKKYTAVIVPKGKSEVFAQQELHHDSGSHVLTLPSATRSVSFTINGTISGAFEITYSYMESVTLQTQKFDIDVMRYGTSNEDYTDWRVCVRFLPRGSYEKTQMVTCEISFPTGYIALDDSVDELNQLEDVVATTLRNDETQLSITFEEIGVQQKCFNVTGFKRNEETRQLPGTIRVFDLADSTNIAYKQLDTKT